eukprot:Lankesteria_metandrocarpae@DN2267_c0_g1_i2.p1
MSHPRSGDTIDGVVVVGGAGCTPSTGECGVPSRVGFVLHGNVAMKVVDLEALRTDSEVDEMERLSCEVQILTVVDHSNIPKFYEAIACPMKHVIIVQEYLVGSARRLYREFGPLPEWIVASVVKDVVEALLCLHSGCGDPSISFAHRDLKAANVLLDSTGSAKLVDYGVCATLPRGGSCQAYVGTPHWMPPEVLRKQSTGTDTDIWSLGITTLELVTGSVPGTTTDNNNDPKEYLHRLAWDDSLVPELPDAVVGEKYQRSPALRDFIKLCLNRNRKKRPSAEALKQHKFLLSHTRRPKSYRDLFIELTKHAEVSKAAMLKSQISISTSTSIGPPNVHSATTNESIACTDDSKMSLHTKNSIRTGGVHTASKPHSVSTFSVAPMYSALI